MIRGELKIERPVKPATNRIHVSGAYDYDIEKGVVIFTAGSVVKEIKVLSVKRDGQPPAVKNGSK